MAGAGQGGPGAAAQARLQRTMARSIAEWRMLEDGDRVLVAVSGGKDSYALLDLLWSLRRRAPIGFDLVAVHVDQGQPGYDGRPLEGWLTQLGAPFEIVRRDTYSKVMELVAEGEARTYCAPCSRFRRGILYAAARRLGCNKLALGHHREDTLETFVMNLLYAGKLQAMPARYRVDEGDLEVIRPLIACAEADLAEHAAVAGYPILPCNLCGSQSGLKRDEVGALLASLEARIPGVKQVMLKSLGNVRPSHLLDAEVAEVWAARPGPAADADAEAEVGEGCASEPVRIGSLPVVR